MGMTKGENPLKRNRKMKMAHIDCINIEKFNQRLSSAVELNNELEINNLLTAYENSKRWYHKYLWFKVKSVNIKSDIEWLTSVVLPLASPDFNYQTTRPLQAPPPPKPRIVK